MMGPLVLSSARLKEPSEGNDLRGSPASCRVLVHDGPAVYIHSQVGIGSIFKSSSFFFLFLVCIYKSHLALFGRDVASTKTQGACIARDCLVRKSSPDVGSTAQPNADNPPAVRAPTQMVGTGHQMNGAIK